MGPKAAYMTLVVALWGGGAAAQQAGPTPADLNAPGAEHRMLDVLEGDWEVTVRFPAGPGRTMEGTSNCQARWVMDGRFLRLEYTSTFRGKPLSVVRYVGFDRYRGKFVEVQFESTHTDVLQAEGMAAADGRSIISYGTHVDAARGKLVPVRSVTTFQGPDTFTLEMFYAEGGGGGATTVTLTHRRRARS